jgi:hypothetical protein
MFNVVKCVVEFDQWQRMLEREDVTIRDRRFPPILETRGMFQIGWGTMGHILMFCRRIFRGSSPYVLQLECN